MYKDMAIFSNKLITYKYFGLYNYIYKINGGIGIKFIIHQDFGSRYIKNLIPENDLQIETIQE